MFVERLGEHLSDQDGPDRPRIVIHVGKSARSSSELRNGTRTGTGWPQGARPSGRPAARIAVAKLDIRGKIPLDACRSASCQSPRNGARRAEARASLQGYFHSTQEEAE